MKNDADKIRLEYEQSQADLVVQKSQNEYLNHELVSKNEEIEHIKGSLDREFERSTRDFEVKSRKLQEQYNAVNDKLEAYRDERNVLSEEITEVRKQLTLKNEELDRSRAQLSAKTEELDRQRNQLAAKTEELDRNKA